MMNVLRSPWAARLTGAPLCLMFALLLFLAGTQTVVAQDTGESISTMVEDAVGEGEEIIGNAVEEAEGTADEVVADSNVVEDESLVDKLTATLDENVGAFNEKAFAILFVSILGEKQSFPLVVAVLIVGGVFFTLFFGFPNIRMFGHAIQVIRGKFDNKEEEGEVSHFQALTSALSATVGLGNIAGVAIAIGTGGPGAVFWMTVAGFFGMSAKFVECTLGQMYRTVNSDGTISGGGMYYMQKGFAEFNNPAMKVFGKILALIFAVFILGAALGGGNMFQANQSFEVFRYVAGFEGDYAGSIYGVVMAIVVGLVIFGGISRIGKVTSKIVPIMAGIYVLAALYIILTNIPEIPGAFATIFKSAFSGEAVTGGIIGVLVIGFQRASFSSEAGLGSAAIAHSAARTKEPAREGIVALIEPFIDTIVICNMTALVIVLSGVTPADVEGLGAGVQPGAVMTKLAFEQSISWFPWVLAISVILFAYSTMISWCYYGERGWIYLLDHLGEGVGLKTLFIFRIVFIGFIYIGAVLKLGAVLDFSDVLLLSLAFPNVLACIILAPRVKRVVNDYWKRHQAGDF